ncbi:uncharacterized protein LOC136028340 isoform X2 [Artemia franciscana]|uniref:Uncharacterized protein n=1 Tax=Artemia franciscana TaxID=6661 RepID=A0AA88KVD1_ARTSF|nr:hypothetical protein QYM36_014167 [Artemia franciscana]
MVCNTKCFVWMLSLLLNLNQVFACGYPGSPSHSSVVFSKSVIATGTVASYVCEDGFELLGPSRRTCTDNGTWIPRGIPFCVMNVGAGKAPMQSSISSSGVPQKAVDGSTSSFFSLETCAKTEVERTPWWYVNLLEPYLVQLVRLDFGQSCCGKNKPATIVVRVGNNRPDLGANPICNKFTGMIEEGRPLFLPCSPPMPGAFVSVHLEGPPGQSLSICEAFVYTDQALPIERCPQFRDQEPGSTATYNGKCYLFYNQQPLNFDEAQEFCQSRGGSLVDETSPALQGFLSWELWRRHRGDPNGQYWMGAFRDSEDKSNWKWLSGKDVTVSFWNLPGGNDDCARFDGTKGWLWSDTNCNLKLHFICQHKPSSCGRPEQPPNATVIVDDFNIGSKIEYKCDNGHLLIGPSERTCMANGFFDEFPPVCKHLQCGLPARIPNGVYRFSNGSRDYLSTVSYECNPGYVLVGRGDLICDVDERWNGPPPRCDPAFCLEPADIPNGFFTLSTNSTVIGTIVSYFCSGPQYKLVGPKRIRCLKTGLYNRDPPYCEGLDPNFRPPYQERGDARERRPSSELPINIDRRLLRKGPYNRMDDDIPVVPVTGNNIDTANIRNQAPPNANEPKRVEIDDMQTGKLNLGGIIALGIFGGFVFLAAVVTTAVIIAKRVKNGHGYRKGGSSGKSNSSGTSSSDRALNKYYQKAWDDLQGSSKGGMARLGGTTRSHVHSNHRDDDFRSTKGTSEGMRDDGEMVVADVHVQKEKKRHHHHHHHKRGKSRGDDEKNAKRY